MSQPSSYTTLQQLLKQAIALQRQRNFAGAEPLYRQALEIDSENYDALHMLGVLTLDTGNGEQAVSLIHRAIRIDGNHALAHYNLGNAYRFLNRHEAAIASYDRALALKPDYAKACNNRGNSLRDLKRTEEAASSYARAIAIDPGFADAHHNHGNVLNELKRHDEAIASYRKALAAGGDTVRLEYELAALGAGTVPAVAPERYIVNVFDGYAERFDQSLVEELNYQTPAITVDAVKRLTDSNHLEILDLGCGTGLCGPLLRPIAATLTGVDLSQNMLNKAHERKVYDHLVRGEITKYLRTVQNAYDIVIATDVFVYIGDLNPVFEGVRGALKAAGLFAFSVEQGETEDFVLRNTKRYAHAAAYLRRLAAAHGFRVESIDSKTIRRDEAADIAGLIAILRLN